MLCSRGVKDEAHGLDLACGGPLSGPQHCSWVQSRHTCGMQLIPEQHQVQGPERMPHAVPCFPGSPGPVDAVLHASQIGWDRHHMHCASQSSWRKCCVCWIWHVREQREVDPRAQSRPIWPYAIHMTCGHILHPSPSLHGQVTLTSLL